uniref:Uncharacterized protein n=1 Tax=Pundamilia nyererei TaxID=303518 RepID=A0A3B4FU35_9CICH
HRTASGWECSGDYPSPQSSWASHTYIDGTQRPFAHVNSPGLQVFWEQVSASSSLPSVQSTIPSQCQDTGMHLLFLHWNWFPRNWVLEQSVARCPPGAIRHR